MLFSDMPQMSNQDTEKLILLWYLFERLLRDENGISKT